MRGTAAGEGRILVAAAFRRELSFFSRSLPAGVNLVFTGMGGAPAHRAAARALESGRYRLVVSTGFAGGTQPGLKVGDLVWAEEALDLASGRAFIPRRAPGNGSFKSGRFVTVPRIVSDPQTKEELGRSFGALAVEMETSGVAQAALEAGVPWVALRAILDPLEQPLWGSVWSFWRAVRKASGSLSDGLRKLVRGCQDKSWHPFYGGCDGTGQGR